MALRLPGSTEKDLAGVRRPATGFPLLCRFMLPQMMIEDEYKDHESMIYKPLTACRCYFLKITPVNL